MVETIFLTIHNHDGKRDTVAPEFYTFVAISHGEVVDMIELQRTGYLNFAGAIRRGLHHCHQLGVGRYALAVVVDIVDKGVEVDLHNCFVKFALQRLGDILELE